MPPAAHSWQALWDATLPQLLIKHHKLLLHLQGVPSAGPGGRQVLLITSTRPDQPGRGRGGRAGRGRGRVQQGRGSGQEASGGRGAGGHETAQGQQAQVSLDSQALLLSVVLLRG